MKTVGVAWKSLLAHWLRQALGPRRLRQLLGRASGSAAQILGMRLFWPACGRVCFGVGSQHTPLGLYGGAPGLGVVSVACTHSCVVSIFPPSLVVCGLAGAFPAP